MPPVGQRLLRQANGVVNPCLGRCFRFVHLGDAIKRADDLRGLADFSRQAIEGLRSNQRQLQGTTRFEFETMADSIEGMYVHLGLTNAQEFTISDTVRGAVNKVLALVEGNGDLDRSFASIVDALSKAGEYTVAQEEEAPQTVELW